ncbi:MAG: hypothetical protein H6837_03355 [Planctomycetes bacterium]|nr:hypothetical protein [Planctomycetota bacterium]
MTLAACGGGGGGGGPTPPPAPDPAPVLIGATFVGAGTTPVAGDTLLLLFSEDVTLTGQGLSDADVDLVGGSLGTLTSPPTLANPRTVQVVLGTGVAFTPGTSAIDVRQGTTALIDRTGHNPLPGTPATITKGDGDAPTIASLTLSEVDSLLNGTGPAGGTIQVPSNGFTIDLTHGDASSGVDAARTIVTASVAVQVAGEGRQAGLDLSDVLVRTSTAGSSSFSVPSTVSFPQGLFELTVYVRDASGMISNAATFSALSRPATDQLRPFEPTVNPTQVWFIDTSRDIESYTVNVLNFITPAQITNGSNGQGDVWDLLQCLGLLTPGADATNNTVKSRFQSLVVSELNALFGGANISFTFTSPGAWPGGSSINYASHSFSRIALAGAAHSSGTTGTLGVAIFDPQNRHQEDDTLVNYQGDRLGVFLHTIVNDGLIAHPTTLFRVTYDPFTAARFGLPIGSDGNDAARLAGSLTDGRTTDIDNAILRMARFAAVVLAHEIGHSVGLVANGAMPVGLYGNDATHFPVYPAAAADGHIKMPASLFSGSSENIMSPAFDFDSALAPQTKFNSLNLAYLRERVLTDGN